MMQKINRQRAKRLYETGLTIYLMPCKKALNSFWIQPQPINLTHHQRTFINLVANFEYYNCAGECGKYAHFYINTIQFDTKRFKHERNQ